MQLKKILSFCAIVLLLAGSLTAMIERVHAFTTIVTPTSLNGIASTNASTTVRTLGPLIPDVLVTKGLPNQNDDILRNNATSSMWVTPDGRLFSNQRPDKGNAWWAEGIGAQGSYVATTTGIRLPCDILATTWCFGLRPLKQGYTGKIVQLTRLSDGTTFDIGVASTSAAQYGSTNGFDMASFLKYCGSDVCRVVKWYNQDLSGNDAVSEHAPLVLTATGNNTFTSTTGVATNDHVEGVGLGCKVDTYVTGTTATTITTNNGCTVTNGMKVMFSKAPVVTAQNRIGTSLAVVYDAQAEWNSSNALLLPYVGVTANATGIIASLRTVASIRGNAPFQLGTSTNPYIAFNNGNGYTGLQISADGSTIGVRYGNEMAFETPYVVTVPAGENAATVENTLVNANSIGGGSLGAVSIYGGYLGKQNATGLSGWYGDVEMADFVVYSSAPTTAQLLEARASDYVTLGLQPQNRAYHVALLPDSLLQGPENAYLLNTPRQLSDILYPYSVRVTNNGWTARKLTDFNSFTTNAGTDSQYKQNFIIGYPSYNDYGGIADCGTYWTTGVIPWLAYATSTGATAVLLTVPAGNFVGTEQSWMASCNTKVIASSTALGYTYIDLASDPAFAGSYYSNTWQLLDGVHPTNLTSALWADKIAKAIIPLLKP